MRKINLKKKGRRLMKHIKNKCRDVQVALNALPTSPPYSFTHRSSFLILLLLIYILLLYRSLHTKNYSTKYLLLIQIVLTIWEIKIKKSSHTRKQLREKRRIPVRENARASSEELQGTILPPNSESVKGNNGDNRLRQQRSNSEPSAETTSKQFENVDVKSCYQRLTP